MESKSNDIRVVVNSKNFHSLAVAVLPICGPFSSSIPAASANKPYALYGKTDLCSGTKLDFSATIFIAPVRYLLAQLFAQLGYDIPPALEIPDVANKSLPVGYGNYIYSMPAFHCLCIDPAYISHEMSCIFASISIDPYFSHFFRIVLPNTTIYESFYLALLRESAYLALEFSAYSIVILVSGIDSFLPAIALSKNVKAFIHVVANKHALGVFQAHLVKSLFKLLGLQDKLVLIDTDWGVFPCKISKNISKLEEYQQLGDTNFLHKYFIDIVAREYVINSFPQAALLTGDTLGIFSAFNGTLQRDRPFIFGRLRGSLRRLLKSSLFMYVYVFASRIFIGYHESCARALAASTFNLLTGRFTSFFPNARFLFCGFSNDQTLLHKYLLSLVYQFSDDSRLNVDLAGAQGFLHVSFYLHGAVRRGAELNCLYGIRHSFLNSSVSFLPYFAQRISFIDLLLRPKRLQYSTLELLINPLKWRAVFSAAIRDSPAPLIKALDQTYYNLPLLFCKDLAKFFLARFLAKRS